MKGEQVELLIRAGEELGRRKTVVFAPSTYVEIRHPLYSSTRSWTEFDIPDTLFGDTPIAGVPGNRVQASRLDRLFTRAE